MARSARVFFCVVLFFIFLSPQVFAACDPYSILLEHEGNTYKLFPTYHPANANPWIWQGDVSVPPDGHKRTYALDGINNFNLKPTDKWDLTVIDNTLYSSIPCRRNYDSFIGPPITDSGDPGGFYAWDNDGIQCGCDPDIQVTIIPYGFRISVQPEGAGTVTLTPSKEGYRCGDVVEARAVPGADWVFLRWEAPTISYENPISYTFYKYGEWFYAFFRNSHVRMEAGGRNPSEGYFSPHGGEYQILANHFTLTNKVSEDAVVSELRFDIEGDLSLLAGATLIRDDGCEGAGTEIAATDDVSGGAATFSGLNETLAGGSSCCYGLILRFRTDVEIPFRKEYRASISRDQVQGQVSGDPADISGDTVTGAVCSAGPKITLTATYDGNGTGDSRIGTFLGGIEALNTLTAHIDMAPENFATVERVVFDINDVVREGAKVEESADYEAVYNMGDFQQTVPLTVTAHLNMNGTALQAQESYTLKALPMPGWFEVVAGISESFTKEFDTEEAAYKVGFTYPTNFIWSDYVPSSVGLLGGLNNDLGIEFTANAVYRIDETSTFGATIKGQPVILGHEFGLEGGLSGDFDQNFAFQRGNGTLRASFAFDLPEKGYSKTFLIYGVPVTAAVDLSGNVEIFIRGSAVLNRQLEFEEITVAPGTTVTGNVTISLSAVFGLAKIAATGSPTATVEIELRYTTASGTTTTWRGEIVVPITVVGSIFWGLGSAELYSTELGPWTFPSGGAAPQAFRPLGEIEGPAVPRLLSTSALAIDGSGRRMTLWIDDRTPAAPAPDPDVFYRYYDGSAWSGSAPLIGTAQTNLEWETDPAVVFLNGGAALAAWTANKGDKSLNDLNDILAHQDIAFALWNGEAWTTPAKVIDDDEADGTVRLAYDGSNQKALAVWVHNADAGKNAMSRTAWKLMYALFDPAANEGAGAFAVPADVPGTATGTADQMPAIAADGAGTVLLLWARDDDGEFYRELSGVTNGTNVDYENNDSHIYWTRWNGTGWNDPQALATGGTATKLSPSVAFSPGGTALAVWTEKEVSQGATMHRLKYAVYADGGWSSPEVITESPRFIEDPKAVVDAAGTATVIWRAYAGRSKGGGALFSSTGQMPAPSWSEPKQITHDDTLQWQADAALDENNKVYTVWSAYDASSGIASTGTGFGSGVNVAQESPNSAALTGVYADAGVDADSNGIYESLAVSLGVNILVAGDYEVRGDLYKGDQFILSALTAEDGLDTGTHTFVLSFPGGILSDRGLDGPYALKQVVVMDRSDSPVQTAFAAAPHTTAAYLASQFVQGPLALDKSSYLGTGETALITVTDALANTSADSVQTIAVEVASTRDYEGFMLGLVETGPDTGVFRGTLGFSLLSSSSELERLLVADHDLIQVIYEDPNRDYRFIERALWTAVGAGDVNSDGQVTLTDAIVTLQCAAHMTTETAIITKDADVDGDERIGMAEILYILQRTAGLR